MAGEPDSLKLVGPLGLWEVALVSGEVLSLKAHAYSQADGEYRFHMLMEGAPPVDQVVFRIPAALVDAVLGG